MKFLALWVKDLIFAFWVELNEICVFSGNKCTILSLYKYYIISSMGIRTKNSVFLSENENHNPKFIWKKSFFFGSGRMPDLAIIKHFHNVAESGKKWLFKILFDYWVGSHCRCGHKWCWFKAIHSKGLSHHGFDAEFPDGNNFFDMTSFHSHWVSVVRGSGSEK